MKSHFFYDDVIYNLLKNLGMPKYLYMMKNNYQTINDNGGKIMIIGIENLKEKQKEKEESEN